MWSSRLFRVSLFLENASILMIWGCFSIVSNVIRSNYCCRRHTMHGNMVFSRDSIFPTPQQSGCLCVCSDNSLKQWNLISDNTFHKLLKCKPCVRAKLVLRFQALITHTFLDRSILFLYRESACTSGSISRKWI